MKKFMRIALVFALAGATLMYTGCTKDYSGDISDLNKKVSEQASALSALQTQVAAAQSSASEALSSAQNALKEAQAAAKAAEAANNDAEVAALTTKIATIEGNIADLQAKVKALDGLEAKLNEVADQLKKDVNAKVDAALEEIQAELDKALAQVEGNFNVTAIEETATYASAKWAPSNGKKEKENLAKLTKVFPELAEIKKDDVVETFGHIEFIVNPSSVELDDTYSFSLVNTKGEDTGILLGNPTVGYDVKAGANVWNVEVQSPAYDEKGEAKYGDFVNLALVVENAEGVSAQTAFDYTVSANTNISNVFDLAAPNIAAIQYHSKDFDGNTIDLKEDLLKVNPGSAPIYYFILEATDAAQIEKYGVSVDGATLTIEDGPEAGEGNATINLSLTAIGVNGKTDAESFTLTIKPAAINANAELAAKEVTLGYSKDHNYDVYVDYAIADFGFSALGLQEVYTALDGKSNTVTVKNAKGVDANSITYENVTFYKADGKNTAGAYSEAAIMRVTVKSNAAKALPGTYTITITDGSVFCAEGQLTIKNPETCPVKLIDALCKDGVLQIVGASDGTDITYALIKALVYNSKEAEIYTGSFVDEDKANDEDSWVVMPANTTFKVAAKKANLYKERNFSVNFKWFSAPAPAVTEPAEGDNYGTFEFKAQAVSPIYAEGGKDAVVVANQTIYIGGDDKTEFKSFEVSKLITSAKYVAGDNVGKAYNVFNTWKKATTPGTPAEYQYYNEVSGVYKPMKSSIAGDKQDAGTVYENAFGAGFVDDQYVLDCETGLPIEFKDFDIETIKLFNSTVPTSAYIALDTYRKGETVVPLYLTTSMFDKLAKVWANYYDKNGTALSAKTKDEKTVWKYSWANTFAPEWLNNSIESFKNVLINYDLATHAAGYANDTDENREKVQDILEADKVAVALFEKYKQYFAKEVTEAGASTSKYVIDKPYASEVIKSVKVTFDDPDEAAKFVTGTNLDAPYIETSPATSEPKATIAVAGTASQFLAGLTSTTLKATIKIEDNWGMTMEIPFTVTVKVASK